MSGGPPPEAIGIATERIRFGLRATSFGVAGSRTSADGLLNLGSLPGVFTSATTAALLAGAGFGVVAELARFSSATTVSLCSVLFQGTPVPALVADKYIDL